MRKVSNITSLQGGRGDVDDDDDEEVDKYRGLSLWKKHNNHCRELFRSHCGSVVSILKTISVLLSPSSSPSSAPEHNNFPINSQPALQTHTLSSFVVMGHISGREDVRQLENL